MSIFNKNPEALLKEATKQKKEGAIDKAIEILKEAYSLIQKGTIIYPIEVFL